VRGQDSKVARTAAAYELGALRFANRADDREWVRPLIARFREFLSDGALVADLGCASGRETVELQEAGLRVVGLDMVRTFLTVAWVPHPCQGYCQGTMTALPFATGTFDGAWASASFLHLSPVEADIALAEAFRVLKSGGVLYTSMQRGSSQGWHECVDPEPGAVRYYRYYEPEEWSGKVRGAGFEVLRLDVKERAPSNNDGATGWLELYARVPSTRPS
jgi:SAM-dependent methyltransferase